MSSRISLLPRVALVALAFGACADSLTPDQTGTPASAVSESSVSWNQIARDLPPASHAAALQPARPDDSTLFDAIQQNLRLLAWRGTDGKYRATARTGAIGPWEASVRDAVWKALFVTTQ